MEHLISQVKTGVWIVFVLGLVLAPSAVSETLAAHLGHRSSYERALPNSGIDIQYGKANFAGYEVEPGVALPFTKADSVSLGLEWLPVRAVGKLGLGATVNYFWANGIAVSGGTAYFHMIQFQPALTYRLDFFRKQFLVPFIKAGLVAAFARQTGATVPREESFYGLLTGGGLELSLSALDPSNASEMYSALGITGTFIVLEYLNTSPLASGDTRANLSNYTYRLGFRLEL